MNFSDSDFSESEEIQIEFVVPSSTTNFRACVGCSLLKTKQEWETQLLCENCGPFYKGEINYKITQKFSGIITVMNPSSSFLCRKFRILKNHLRAGAYGI